MFDRTVVMEHLKLLLQNLNFGLDLFQGEFIDHHKPGKLIFNLLEFLNLVVSVHLHFSSSAIITNDRFSIYHSGPTEGFQICPCAKKSYPPRSLYFRGDSPVPILPVQHRP
ncbi:hypothetical protein D3C73_1251310 [compost metagenome]